MQQKLYGYYVPCSHVAILAAFAGQHNIKMQPILSQYKLSSKKINTPDALMLAEQYSQLLLSVDMAAHDHAIQEDFWFSFARQLNFSAYGVLGQALLSCENFQQALALLVKYYQVLSCGSDLTCHHQDRFFSLNIHRQSAVGSRDSIIRSEILVTSIINGLRALLPDNAEKLRVEFDYKKPSYHALYPKNLTKNCIFSAPQSKILIPDQYLKQPCPHANPVMLDIFTQQLDQVLIQLQGPKSIAAKVRKLIATIPGAYPAVDDVAQQIGISSRTLSRYLKDNNTTFQALVNQVKCQQASHYLQSSNLSIEQIATQVGFGDSANFRRAFSGWTGMTPSQFRKQNKGA